MMEALQDLSTRMSAVEDAQEIHVDQVQSHNGAAVSFPFPPSGLPPRPRSFPALAGSGGPGFPSNDGGDGFDDEDEELVRDRMPQSFTREGHCGCSFASVCRIRSGSFQCFGFQSLEKPVVADHGKVGYQ